MADWMTWLVAAGVIVIFELFTGTFYLLMIGIGVACGGLAALAGLQAPGQTLVAAVVGVLATGLLWRSKYGRPERGDPARDPNVNMDIGQTVHVAEWLDGTARVMYRGAMWDVDLAPGTQPAPGQFTIREVRGSRLVVAA
ncbi:NfeD family protein [Rugamonas sp. CCM 8940]|uniref:NfeD family protein n=1 Tax=Rugamonas sp. CCM 8940 TaxID=2765359 RepID=UPI0018F765D3|nr:NfeD family protein [Rugamonas sp. CCM 8940]MBJ7311445.1 NfeD family protein [Rugamonas sp. CCM 8940]